MAIISVFGISVEYLEDFLPILSNYRNLCAHEDILYCNRTQRAIDDTMYHSILGIEKVNDEYKYGKNDLFALVIILRQLLSNTEVKNLVIEIDRALNNLEINLKSIPVNKIMDQMGFPENWKEIANIER